MQIPFDSFEKFIDKNIVKSGLSYFHQGRVQEIEEIHLGKYEAIVEGSEDYKVDLTLINDVITECYCDCPYDCGPVCKHIVAVIYSMKENQKVLSKNKAPNNSIQPTKHKTVAYQINELLEKVTHDELKQFITENATSDATFRNLVLSSFAHHNSNETKDVYIRQIKSILRMVSDKHGFNDRSASRFFGSAVNKLLESAQKMINNKNYKSAFYICTAVMEQMVETLQYTDDSNGDIGEYIDSAYEMLDFIAQEQTSEDIRRLIIEYCFMVLNKQLFSGLDWHIGVLRIASLLIKTDEDIERIFALIEKEEQGDDYERENAQTIKYEILLKTKGENIAEKFIENNLANSDLRVVAIEKALEKKNYEKAISIAKDGVSFDLKDKPGLAKQWYDWLLRIAQAQNDTENIIKYARFLFIDNFRNEQDYYQILKQQVEPDKWVPFIEKIILEIDLKKHLFDTEQIANIFIKEEWWDRLLELVQKSPELHNIKKYEKYLSKYYTVEIVELYADAIIKYLKNNMGRNHYQNACIFIRKIIKLGSIEKANEIISYLRTQYPQRKALIEELNKI